MIESLKNVLKTLPRRTTPLSPEGWDSSFKGMATTPTPYVWPDVESVEQLSNVPVLLLTAPGAMGKSAAAQAIASELKAPIVDLSKLPVGSDSLTGLLTRTLGWAQAAEFISELVAGKATIVLDSVDEAQLLAGREHFLAFMKNVQDLIKTAKPCLQVIILGRKDAIETTFLALQELGIPSRIANIQPMSRANANELLALSLDQKALYGQPYKVHRVHPGPASTLRDRVFAEIASALLGKTIEASDILWTEVKGFLGYPPVLMALSEWLTVENPAASDPLGTSDEMSDRSDRFRRGTILRRVVEQILDRESLKVRQQICSALEMAADDRLTDIIYTRTEQVERLARYVLSDDSTVDAPASLPPAKRAVYEERIESFVPDHPFLVDRAFSNVVFSDYILAHLATSPTSALSRDLWVQLRQIAAVGPFFCHFVHALLQELEPTAAEPSFASLNDEELVNEVAASFRAGCSQDYVIQYIHTTGPAYLFLLEDSGSAATRTDILIFKMLEPAGVVEFVGPLSNTSIITKNGVILRSIGAELELGPNFSLFAEDLELACRRVVVHGESPSEPAGELPNTTSSCVLVAATVTHDSQLQVTSFPSNTLSISWHDPAYIWRQFQMLTPPPATDVIDRATSWQIMFGLRRILLSFHSRAQTTPTIVSERMEGFVLGHNSVYRATLDGLIELSAVKNMVSSYSLDLTRLGEFGVNYDGISGDEFEASLTQLHSAVCQTDAISKLLMHPNDSR